MSTSNNNENIITGNTYNKYSSKNPIVKKLMQRFLNKMESFISDLPCKTMLELGCGEGELVPYFFNWFKELSYYGFDIDDEMLANNRNIYKELNSN